MKDNLSYDLCSDYYEKMGY